MEKEYRIGNHLFPDEVEYQKAKKDYEYILRFQKELDLSKPEVAKSLYERLRKSKYLMKTTLGDSFKDKLVQIFVLKEVQDKKQKLLEVEKHSFKEFLDLTLSNPYMRWYWRWFEITQCCFVLGSLAAIYEATHFATNIKGWKNILRQACAIVSIFNHILIWIMILVSLLFLGEFFVQKVQRKPRTAHCINLIVLSGVWLCIELLFLN